MHVIKVERMHVINGGGWGGAIYMGGYRRGEGGVGAVVVGGMGGSGGDGWAGGW